MRRRKYRTEKKRLNKRKLDKVAKRDRNRVFMNKIIMPLLVATAAIGVSLLLIQFCGGYYAKIMQKEAPKIQVEPDGILYVDMQGETEDMYILWETDGGNLSAVSRNENLKEQYSEENPGYQLYAGCNEKVVWSPEDADGNRYTTATIAATVYMKSEEEGINCYYIDYNNLQTMLAATVTCKDGNVTKEEDNRYFSNPIREGGNDWAQIYAIKTEDNKTVYRYRVGYDLSEKSSLTVSFESSDAVLYEADYQAGLYPAIIISEDAEAKALLSGVQAVTVYNSDLENGQISIKAYMQEKDSSEKLYPAEKKG